MDKDVFKGEGFFLKSKGKEVERKRKTNKMGGGGLIVNIFFVVKIFSSGVVIILGIHTMLVHLTNHQYL